MCGICLVLNIPIENHHFNFEFLKIYNPSQQSQILPLNKHIQKNQLTLPTPNNLNQFKIALEKRGPDVFVAHHIDMYKTIYSSISPSQNRQVDKGNAIGMQSILHLRGSDAYVSDTPGSYFLYNGQIWDTGNLQPIDEQHGENDARWLHRLLMNCRGSQERMLQTMNQIRGDFAVILIEADQVFILKDYFGKRSLLLGMSQKHLIFTSTPHIKFINKEEGVIEQQINQDEAEEGWKAKYQAEWLSSRNKYFFQMPSNSLITIRLRGNQAHWNQQQIYRIDLKGIGAQKMIIESQEVIDKVKQLLIQSARQITKCIRLQHYRLNQFGCKIAVLFSGGIDSSIIARLLDLTLPKDQQIDLVNLAFKEDAPDRQAAKISYEQLCSLNPSRKYKLILVNKSLNDIDNIKDQLMKNIYPKTTHMDFNIAAALHLASAATSAKIVTSGLGADQIFAGYSRYRIAFKRAGYQQMENQMLFDMERLWIRNLGRDDRSIGANGKEARYPFLYLPLWKYLRKVPLPILTQGNGQKMLLRIVARQLGLEKSSQFKKKAIQFGTKLAKLSNIKSFGSNRKAKGTHQYR